MAVVLGTHIELDTADHVGLDRCHLEGDHLVDGRTGQRRMLNPTAVVLAQALVERPLPRVTDLLARARKAWPTASDVDRDVVAWLTACDAAGLLVVRRSWAARVLPASLAYLILTLLTLAPRRRERRRFDATPLGCARAVAHALTLPAAIAAGTLVPAAVVMNSAGVGGPWRALAFATVPLVSVAVVGLTLMAHELGHIATAEPESPVMCCFVQGMALTLVHRVGTQPSRRCAVAGPLAGAVVAVAVGLALVIVVDVPGVFAPAAVVAIAHVASLSPWSADGRNLGLWPTATSEGDA